AFVDLAALDDGGRATALADRLAEARPAVNDEEVRLVEIEAALAQISEKRLADGRVLGRALAQGEDVLAALRIHAQREQDHVVAEVEAVDDEDADVEVIQRAGEPRRQLCTRERDEAPRDAALRDRARRPPSGQGVEGAGMLSCRDADRDRLQRAGIEGIAARGVGEARERELVAVDTAGAQPWHADAAPAERDLAGRLAVAVGAAIGIGDVLRSTEPLAILFHHRAQHLLARVEAEAEERGAGVGEDVEQRHGAWTGGDGGGRGRSPNGRSCAPLPQGGSFRMVVGTAVLPWTAEGAAAPSSAGQFNRRRDIPRAPHQSPRVCPVDTGGIRPSS